MGVVASLSYRRLEIREATLAEAEEEEEEGRGSRQEAQYRDRRRRRRKRRVGVDQGLARKGVAEAWCRVVWLSREVLDSGLE